MKKTIYKLLLCILFIGYAATGYSQVTIGSLDDPQGFSILELISGSGNTGGLRMPQLTEAERNTLTGSAAFQAEKMGKAVGLTIYNTTNGCIEFWNGTEWISRCGAEDCPPVTQPGSITLFPSSPNVNNGDSFTASVAEVENAIFYEWALPTGLVITGGSGTRSITVSGLPGTYSGTGLSVIAVNRCGEKSTARSGTGTSNITVKNCNAAPTAPTVVLWDNTFVSNANSGSGNVLDPILITEGNTFIVSYNGQSDVAYTWSLSSGGSNYFETVSSGNGTIVLRAKSYQVDGAYCDANAIQLTASNDCGTSATANSGIRIKIVSVVIPCPQPAAPTGLALNKNQVIVGETFTASVTAVAGMAYTWTVPGTLTVVGSSTANPITLKAMSAGTINLAGLSVTATNDCGNTSLPANGTGSLRVTPGTGLAISPIPGPLPAQGTDAQRTTAVITVTNPDCLSAANYSYAVKSGSSYASLQETSSAGTFKVRFTAHTTTSTRSAVITVTDACGNSKDFTFTQAAYDCVHATSVALTSTHTEIAANKTFTLTATATGGTGHTYQWYRNGSLISGVSGATLARSETTAGTYTYYVKTKAACETGYAVQSTTVTVTVKPPCSGAPGVAISSSPAVASISAGTRVTLTAAVTGGGVLTYKWYRNGTAISGATNASYVISSYTMGDRYSCEVYNGCGTTTTKWSTCGANIDSGWLTFMCHNLGANENLDPFTPAQGLHGAKYKFGAKQPTLTMVEDQSTSGEISGWSGKPYQSSGNWSSANSPCPAGWRMPTLSEWSQVVSNNTVRRTGSWSDSATNYTAGIYFGDALFLPAAGRRGTTTGALYNRGEWVNYWSSTMYGNFNGNIVAYVLDIRPTTISASQLAVVQYGYPIRCVR